MNLQPNTTFEIVKSKLDIELINSFCPIVNEIPNIDSKGIYFWFMKQDAYTLLSQHETISPIEPIYTKTIKGEKYDLVYLGTAGTGKKGNSNLKNRFDWHIIQNHSNSNICNGTLSTLRTGLGALLAEDLILPNTEELVNTFMKNSMILFWVEYPNNNELIDSDEKILINAIKPLLNLKSNYNARLTSLDNSTKSYKRRRALVCMNTRLRLSCKGENEKSMKTIKTPTEKSTNYDDQILDVNNNCVEYYVSNGQFIDEVTRGIDNLPTHKAKIKIWDSKNQDNIFNEWQFRSTGDDLKPDAQNIYTYFSNTHNNKKRAEIIMNWMNANQIEEITVRVCSTITTNNKTNKSKAKSTKPENNLQIENIKLSKNFKVVVVCSQGKNDSFFTAYPNKKFVNLSTNNLEQHPDDIIEMQNKSWRDYLEENQSDPNLKKAFQLYKRKEYCDLNNKFKNNFYILSAGWGLINSHYKLPKYDITFSSSATQKNKRKDNINGAPIYQDFNKLNIVDKEDIVFFGGKDYIKLFYKLTKDFENRKIIYFYGNKRNIPKSLVNSNNFYFVKYNSKNNRAWHYEAACSI
jgi:hypothetical protein